MARLIRRMLNRGLRTNTSRDKNLGGTVRTENSIERFPVNVTLLLPDRLLNPGSGSLPHVADFNGIRRRWDLRDAQAGRQSSRPCCIRLRALSCQLRKITSMFRPAAAVHMGQT